MTRSGRTAAAKRPFARRARWATGEGGPKCPQLVGHLAVADQRCLMRPTISAEGYSSPGRVDGDVDSRGQAWEGVIVGGMAALRPLAIGAEQSAVTRPHRWPGGPPIRKQRVAGSPERAVLAVRPLVGRLKTLPIGKRVIAFVGCGRGSGRGVGRSEHFSGCAGDQSLLRRRWRGRSRVMSRAVLAASSRSAAMRVTRQQQLIAVVVAHAASTYRQSTPRRPRREAMERGTSHPRAAPSVNGSTARCLSGSGARHPGGMAA